MQHPDKCKKTPGKEQRPQNRFPWLSPRAQQRQDVPLTVQSLMVPCRTGVAWWKARPKEPWLVTSGLSKNLA